MEVQSEREKGEGGRGRSNKRNGEEEKRAADEDETGCMSDRGCKNKITI